MRTTAAKFLISFTLAAAVYGQAPAAAPASTPPAERETILTDPLRRLRIIPLSTNTGVNRLNERIIATPVVEIRDGNDLPIEGASVTFRLPETGAGGTFPGGKYLKTVVTDAQGQAIADGFSPNELEGAFRIVVTATFQGVSSKAELAQRNTRLSIFDEENARRRSFRKKLFLYGGIAGAAAAGLIIWKTGGSSSGTTVSASPGTVTIGGR